MLSKLRSTVVCLFALLAVCATASLRAQTFTNPYRIPTSVDPDGVVAGDINGDGLPDILWTDSSVSPHVLHTLLARSSGGYVALPDLALPNGSNDLCLLTDLNLDHHLDLVCTAAEQLSASVEVLLGNGDGTFQSPIVTALNTFNSGNYAGPLVQSIGDVNGDGFPDLYEEDVNSYTAQILLGNGKGGFQPGIQLQPATNLTLPVVAADVNGDGHPDLLYSVGPAVALGNGDGTFGFQVSYTAAPYYLATCIFHDMDGDGRLDAVCGYGESYGGDITGDTDLIILHGNPDGSFNTAPISDTPFGNEDTLYDGYGTFEEPLAIADVNGDGILDVLGESGDGLAVLLGGAGLTFGTPLHYAQAVAGLVGQVTSSFESQILDLNGDGIPDVVAAGPNGVYITYGRRDGSFASAFAPEVAEVIGYPTIADFNGDGIPDIAATGDTAIKLSLGKGDGTFDKPVALPNNNGATNFSTPLSATIAHIAHGDFNGDGKLDLLAIGSPNIYQYDAYILFGHGDGTFDPPILVPDSSNSPFYNRLTDSAVFDINRDGRSDLLSSIDSTNSTGPNAQISFSLSHGDGVFSQVTTTVPSDLRNSLYPVITLPALADFNGDGKLDAAYGSITNAYVVSGHGDGSFDTAGAALAIPSLSGVASQGASAVATGDFDGDGNQDFVVLANYGSIYYTSQPLTAAAWVYYGKGDGTFSSAVLAGSFDHSYTNIAAADLNGDGLADLVVNTNGSVLAGYVVGVLDSQPGRTFAPEMNYTAGTGLTSLAIADINQDGRPDLVFGNGDFNIRASSVTTLLNEGTSTSASAAASVTSLNCRPSTISLGGNSLLSAMVTSSAGTPTGAIRFTDNGVVLNPSPQSSPLTNGVASLTYTGQAAGVHAIVATYVPTGSFAASSASCTIDVSSLPATAVLTVNPTSSTVGSSVNLSAAVTPATAPGAGTPTGTVTFSYTGSASSASIVLGTATLASGVANLMTTALPAGQDNISCSYSGSTIYSPATCNSVPFAAAAVPISLTSSANPAPALTPITFTAQLATSSGGTVTFMVNGESISATPNAAGTATYTISTLTAGTYPVTATWFAPGHALAVQATLTQVVTAPLPAPDFSFTGSSISFAAGSTGAGSLTLASLGGFTGNIAVTCNPPFPPNYTCSLELASVSLGPGLSKSLGYTLHTITVQTSNTTSANHPNSATGATVRIVLAGLFPVALLSVTGLIRRRRRTYLHALLSLTLLTIFASVITACGPPVFSPATPAGTYPITFTATGTNQGSSTPLAHSLTINATLTRSAVY